MVPWPWALVELSTICAIPTSSFAIALLDKDMARSSGRCTSYARTALQMRNLVLAQDTQHLTLCERVDTTFDKVDLPSVSICVYRLSRIGSGLGRIPT